MNCKLKEQSDTQYAFVKNCGNTLLGIQKCPYAWHYESLGYLELHLRNILDFTSSRSPPLGGGVIFATSEYLGCTSQVSKLISYLHVQIWMDWRTDGWKSKWIFVWMNGWKNGLMSGCWTLP